MLFGTILNFSAPKDAFSQDDTRTGVGISFPTSIKLAVKNFSLDFFVQTVSFDVDKIKGYEIQLGIEPYNSFAPCLSSSYLYGKYDCFGKAGLGYHIEDGGFLPVAVQYRNFEFGFKFDDMYTFEPYIGLKSQGAFENEDFE